MGKIIGINQRISVTLIEKGLKAVFDGVYNKEFARSLAEYEFQGENRLKKAVNELSKVVEKNAIIPFLMEHKEQVLNAMQYKADRAIIVAALYNSAFPFSYEEVCILGKYFHVQDQVSRKLLEEKIEPRLLKAFKRIRGNARNGLGIVYVQRNACGGCFNRIPAQRQVEIKMHKKIIVCEYCGRILIDPELAGVKEEA